MSEHVMSNNEEVVNTQPTVVEDTNVEETKTIKKALCATRESVQAIFGNIPPVDYSGNPCAVNVNGPNDWLNQLEWSLQPRSTCENEPAYLQLIPYITLISVDTEKQSQVIYKYVRGTASNEDRLINKLSIGLGGHIETIPNDEVSIYHVIAETIVRELSEEVGLPYDTGKITMLENLLSAGACPLIYSDFDDVGKVHLGLQIILQVDFNIQLDPDKVEVTQAGFATTKELVAEMTSGNSVLEDWSIITLSRIITATNQEGQNQINQTVDFKANAHKYIEEMGKQINELSAKKSDFQEMISKFDTEQDPVVVITEYVKSQTIDITTLDLFTQKPIQLQYVKAVVENEPLIDSNGPQ